MNFSLTRFFYVAGLLCLAFDLSACGLLIGSVKPVDEKSDQYGVTDLSKESPSAWTRIDSEDASSSREPDATSTEVSDVAFQANHSPSVIALNSSCRPSVESQDKDLKALTRELLLGISDVTQRVEKNLTIQSTPALETTLQGRMNGNIIAVRSVVLRRNACVYDLLYMATPKDFDDHEKDFSRFVASLRLK